MPCLDRMALHTKFPYTPSWGGVTPWKTFTFIVNQQLRLKVANEQQYAYYSY
jgi:hypothetical protein